MKDKFLSNIIKSFDSLTLNSEFKMYFQKKVLNDFDEKNHAP